MKKITVTILSFFFIAQLFAQDGYLLDSFVNAVFLPTPEGLVTGTKYHYDQQNRIILEDTEQEAISYEYGKNSVVKKRFDKSSHYSISIEKKLNPSGGVLYEATYYQASPTAPKQPTTESYVTRDIYNDVVEEQRFYNEDGTKLKNSISSWKYNKFRFLETYEYTPFDEETQEAKYTTYVKHTYDDNKNLITLVFTQTNPQDGTILYSDSTNFSYDNLDRLTFVQYFNGLGEKSTTRTLSYLNGYHIENITTLNGSVFETVRYDASNAFAPYDSVADYEFILSDRILTKFQTYADISSENPSYDFALLHRKVRLKDDGSLQSLRQSKSLFRKTPASKIILNDEIKFEILSNPVLAHNYFNIFSELGSYDQVQIFNIAGALVSTKNSNGLSINTFRAPGPSGSYFIRLLYEGKVVSETKKMVVI